MRLSWKLLVSGVLFGVLSAVCFVGVWRRTAAMNALSEYLGMTHDFQQRLVELSCGRDRQETERQLTELQHVFETMDGRPEILREIGGRYRGKGKVIQGELAIMKVAVQGANRGQDAGKIRELSEQMGDLAGMCVARIQENRRTVRRYGIVWLVGGLVLLLLNGVWYWTDVRNRLKKLSLELVANKEDGGVYQPLHDISEISPALKQYMERSGKRVQGHEFFLAEMSHEIRTPLNGVIGFLSNLGATSLNAQQKQYVRIIDSSARSLLHVINEVLDYSKINGGKMELEDVAFDLRALAEDRIAMASQLGKAKGLHCSLLFPGHEPVIVRGDANRLRQVLDNLLNNAVKFTERGEVCLEIQLGEAENNQLVVDFAVKDTGIGIPASKLPDLFQPFKQADSSVSRKYGGTGLGLSISSSLVGLMGGKLEVWSRQGEGSRFYFMLQMARANAAAQVRLSGSFRITLPRNELKKHFALLVDDTPTNLFLLETVCQSIGLPYRTAANGAEAVELCMKQKFDVIFMDIQMPVMDGYTAIREIRKLPTSTMTAIIALTASAFQEDVERALSAGATGFIAKPFERNQLLMCIADALVIEPVREAVDETDMQETEDEATVRQMHDFMREQYQISLGEIKMTLAQTVADWRPLLDNLRIYAKKGNVADTRAILHRLKGQLSSIGLPEQSEQAAMLMECLTDDEVPERALNGIEELIRDLGRIFRQLEQEVTVVK
ncbi:MAG: response regulator [Victivallales bacterium]|nr:response regulator [Victivallales bacterium]